MVFIHFASTNQLRGFSKSGTLPAPNMRNTEPWLLSLIRSGTESESIRFGSPRNNWKHINLLKFRSVNLETILYACKKISKQILRHLYLSIDKSTTLMMLIMSIVCLQKTLNRYIRLAASHCSVNYVQPYMFQILEVNICDHGSVFGISVISWLVSGDASCFLACLR